MTDHPSTQALLLQEVINVMLAVKEKITDESDVIWTRYDHPQEIRTEIDNYLSQLQTDPKKALPAFGWLFAPTGTLQEHAISNGWTDEYMILSSRFDTLYAELKKDI